MQRELRVFDFGWMGVVCFKKKTHLNPLQAPPKKEVEKKRVIREGYNSLITHPNASCFSVFSHVRHLVLQNQLCETYNARLNVGDEEEGAGEKGREVSKKEQIKMPVVCTQCPYCWL